MKKALSLILALCLVLVLVPLAAQAAEAPLPARVSVEPVLRLDPEALPEPPAELNRHIYYDVVEGSEHGHVELDRDHVSTGTFVYLTVDPDDGYLAELEIRYEYSYHDISVKYIGQDVYRIRMPDGDVNVDIRFVKAEGESHTVTTSCTEGGTCALSRTSAKQYESIILAVTLDEGYQLAAEDVTFDSGAMLYLGQEENVHYFEVIIDNSDIFIHVCVRREPPKVISIAVTDVLYNTDLQWGQCGGEAFVDPCELYPGEEFILTCVPTENYSIYYISCEAPSGTVTLSSCGNNQFRGVMPNDNVHIVVSYTPIPQPITVTVTDNIGGTASVDLPEAGHRSKIRLTCVPDPGYRVASVTAADPDLLTQYDIKWKDNGDNTYTFYMPNKPVDLEVTFEPIVNPITVSVDNNGIGGAAYTDVAEAPTGSAVTLTCEPEEGYRVARITGVEYTDNGDGTYTFEMPGAPADIRVLFLRQDNPFLDVWEPQYYYDPVLWAVSEGITNGMTPTMFEPGTTCTRAQVVTFLWRAAGKPETKSTEHPFQDVTVDYYYKAMLWAVENGITNGMSPTTFEPGTTCTRAQVVTFLWRAAGKPEPKTTEHPFEDVTVDYYYKAMLWAVENGITNGMSLTTFEPGTTCTRGQVVTFLYRADQLPDPEPTPEPTPEPDPEPTPDPEPGMIIPPSDEDGPVYILNLATQKFHHEGCFSAEKIEPENYHRYVGPRERLIEYGYSPCGHCDP